MMIKQGHVDSARAGTTRTRLAPRAAAYSGKQLLAARSGRAKASSTARHAPATQGRTRMVVRSSNMNGSQLYPGQLLSKAEQWVSTKVLGDWSPDDIPNLQGKTALITGANSGMGFETARNLAKKGAKVFMVARNMKAGQEAVNQIRAEVGKTAQVELLHCDMARLDNVAALAREFKQKSDKLDILVNMAGVFFPGQYAKTPDGIEQTLAIDYYAAALLTLSLLDTVKSTPGSRVIMMSSGMEFIGQLDWNNLLGDKWRDSGIIPYGTAKLYMSMFSAELSRQVPTLDVFCVQPGLVATPLHEKSDWRYFINAVFKISNVFLGSNPEFGAFSAMYAATEPKLHGQRFKFFGPSLLFMNMFPTTERPSFRKGHVANTAECQRLFEETQRTFDKLLGQQAPSKVQELVKIRA